ncbi:Protein of unknown function [Gryllus bimaculatus]|nr:Protein of unknown function [Gryllus bimaculatus]
MNRSRGGKTSRAGDRNRILASSNEITVSSPRELLRLGDSRCAFPGTHKRCVRTRFTSVQFNKPILILQAKQYSCENTCAQPPLSYAGMCSPACYGCCTLPIVAPSDPSKVRRVGSCRGLAPGLLRANRSTAIRAFATVTLRGAPDSRWQWFGRVATVSKKKDEEKINMGDFPAQFGRLKDIVIHPLLYICIYA